MKNIQLHTGCSRTVVMNDLVDKIMSGEFNVHTVIHRCIKWSYRRREDPSQWSQQCIRLGGNSSNNVRVT